MVQVQLGPPSRLKAEEVKTKGRQNNKPNSLPAKPQKKEGSLTTAYRVKKKIQDRSRPEGRPERPDENQTLGNKILGKYGER